jgi:hypothetical protein
MPVSQTFAALGRLFRRPPLPPDDILEAYAHEVVPVLDRAEWLYQYWLEQSTLFSDSEKLGNVAAIHRWETASMGRSLERVRPPAVLAGAHESVLDALDMASRAAQLLSSGSRFHNASAVCEGQALLVTSRDRRLTALRAMRRYLAAVIDAAAAVEPAEPQAAQGADPPAALAASTITTQAAQPEAAASVAPEARTTDVPPDQLLIGEQPDADAQDEYDAYDAHDDNWHDYGYDHEEAHDDDDEEDALPWLTRLAEQPAAPESLAPSAPLSPPPSNTAPAVPPPAASPPAAPPVSPPAPTVPPPAAAPSASTPPPTPGWGSLFRRPPEPPGPDDSAPPRA